MTFAGITIDDTDSLDAAADLRESYDADVERLADEYAAESGLTIDDYDGDGDDPDDPSPVTPAALPGSPCRECTATGTRRLWTGGRLTDWIETVCGACNGTGTTPVPVPAYQCATCHDTGRVTKPSAFFRGKTIEGFCPDCIPHYDFARREFPNCGTANGEASASPTPEPIPFDRAAHCRKIASYGGMATLTTHGVHHFCVIGQTGAKVTIERHGYAFWRGIVAGKGLTASRKPHLLSNLAAGRALADLRRAA
jgi:hypothetical protein